VKGLQDKNDTGNFEIRLMHPWRKPTEKEPLEVLLHSKKTRNRRGDWLLRSEKERNALVAKIDNLLLEPRAPK
jgi:hypothetical protein